MKTLAREACKAEIVERLRSVRPQSTARWGRMSAHQMVCHLGDGCRMVTCQIPVSGAPGRLRSRLIKWVALYIPVRWPAGIRTSPELDQHIAGTRPGDFAADLAELERLLDLVATREKSVMRPGHPVFGRMSRSAWLRWAYLHADHHLRQFGA